MKDYLKADLTDNEVRYIRKIIKNTVNEFLYDYYGITNNESLCLDDESFDKEFEDNSNPAFDFINKILDTKILKDISALKPYTQYEKEKIVKIVDDFAHEAGYERFIVPLTFNEKLVVFLLYMENYQVNEVALLLNVKRLAIWKRDKSIKRKIKEIKEKLENGK